MAQGKMFDPMPQVIAVLVGSSAIAKESPHAANDPNRSARTPAQGWASNLQALVNESLRRYLESHQDVLAEQFILDDVQWGLHGND